MFKPTITMLETVENGVAFPATRSRPPSRCPYMAGGPADLREPAKVSYEDIDAMIANGYVTQLKPYNGFCNVILTYAGRLKLLTLNGWMKSNLEGWRKVYKQWICCDKAIPANCVCMVRTMCPDHGDRCHGTHD